MWLGIRPEQSRLEGGQAQFVGPRLTPSPNVPIHGKRPERKILAVPVIAQIEDARKARARMANLFPRAVFSLMAEEIINSSHDADGIRHAGRQERQQGPRSLRRRTLATAGLGVIGIGGTAFTPSAIRVLHRFQPGHGARDM